MQKINLLRKTAQIPYFFKILEVFYCDLGDCGAISLEFSEEPDVFLLNFLRISIVFGFFLGFRSEFEGFLCDCELKPHKNLQNL